MRRWNPRLATAVACLSLGWAVPVHAVPLAEEAPTPLPGTTAIESPHLDGSVVENEVVPFSFQDTSSGQTYSGSVEVRVIEADDGTIDFTWQVTNDATSPGPIGALRIADFHPDFWDGDYREDGLGDDPPDHAFRLGEPFEGYVNFVFPNSGEGDPGLLPGVQSKTFFLDTDAPGYAKTAIYDVTEANNMYLSQGFQAWAPDYGPEPSRLALLLAGGVALTGLRQLRRTSSARSRREPAPRRSRAFPVGWRCPCSW